MVYFYKICILIPKNLRGTKRTSVPAGFLYASSGKRSEFIDSEKLSRKLIFFPRDGAVRSVTDQFGIFCFGANDHMISDGNNQANGTRYRFEARFSRELLQTRRCRLRACHAKIAFHVILVSPRCGGTKS